MPLRHIIVEGPDGAGKSTLISSLIKTFGYPVHERASHSKTGPVERVDLWALDDIQSMGDQPPSIYDRHPIISEPIYASLARNEVPHGCMIDPVWRKTMRAQAAKHALLVLCMPPMSIVERNVRTTPDNQMPGVFRNITAIYHAYWQAWDLWPGYGCSWNYTANITGAGYDALVADMTKLMSMEEAPHA